MAFGEPDEHYSQTQGGVPPAIQRMYGTLVQLPHSALPTAKSEDDDYDLPPRQSWSIAPIMADMIQQAKDADGHVIFQDVGKKTFTIPLAPWPTGESSLPVAGPSLTTMTTHALQTLT